MMVLGALAIYNLPISQYPPIAPPSIAIECAYPGASAETVENSVTQIIEQKMTGFDDMLYLSGTSDSSGFSRIELTFKAGTDPDLAWAKVQNKLQLAMTSLPDVVQRTGVMVSKSTRNYLIIVGLTSEDGSMDGNDLRDYAQSNLEKVLARVPGVGEVTSFGSQYAMRVWLNPDKLTEYQLTIEDVILALRSYNVEISAGQFGGQPAMKGQRLNASIVVQNLLQTPDEFADIPVRMNSDGSIVRIRDVGRTELGTESYDIEVYFNGKPNAAMAIRQAPGANALDTANAVKAKLEEMSHYFPPGMKVIYPYDTTPFVEVAIEEVVKTLIEAVVLVFLVMYLFMGNIRATLIPTIAVPVVLLGTFAVLGLFDYSINMLTMFAMVLAIGLLVDDAIVVVENVERIMGEEGLSPREATAKSMDQITSALIGIGLVLSAVFGPMAFFSGSTGVIYRQFSVTIIASMLLSVLVALILTPVLCASLLRPVVKGHEPAENSIFFLRPFFRWFDRVFFWIRDQYVRLVGHSLAKRLRYLVVYVVIVVAVGYLYMQLPSAYLPDEDQGMLMCQVLMPTGTTLEQTKEVANEVARHFRENEKEAVESCMTISGMSFSGRSQNNAMVFVKLKKWEQRDEPELKVTAVAGRAMKAFLSIRNARVFAFPPPPVVELGSARGVDFQLVDRGGVGHDALMAARSEFLRLASQDPRLAERAAQRPGGCAGIPHRRGLGRRRRAGPVDQFDSHDPLRGLRQLLRQQLHQGRTRQAGVCPGRRPLPHAAQRPGEAVCAKQDGQDGSVYRVRLEPLVLEFSSPGTFQRLSLAEHLGGARTWDEFRGGNAGTGRDRGQAAFGDRLRLYGPVVPGANVDCPGADAVCLLGAGDLPVRGSPVRELDDPLRQPPDAAAGRVRCAGGNFVAGIVERRLFPDRFPDNARAFDEERDPHHPVHQGTDAAGRRTR